MTPETWTYANLRGALQRVLSQRSPYAWIVDVKPIAARAIYGDGGQTYEAPYSVDPDGTVTLGAGAEVREQTVYWPADEAAFASFSDATDATGRVRRSGLIFRAGRYPERPIREITEDDLDAIARSVPDGGAPIILDHNEHGFLTAALESDGARLLRAWRVGDELHGEVEVPGWFAAAARDLRWRVSVGLDSTLRAIRELSFVKNPRVADAALFSSLPCYALFAGAHPGLAPTPPDGPAQSTMPTLTLTLRDRIKALFRGLPAEQREGATEADLDAAFSSPPADPAVTPLVVPPAAPPAVPAVDAALAARIARLESEFAESAAQAVGRSRHERALAFYETQLRAGRVRPSEREDVVGDHEAAQIADESQRFAATDAASFVRRVEARYAARPVAFSLAPRIDSASPADAANLGVFSEDDFAALKGRKGGR